MVHEGQRPEAVGNVAGPTTMVVVTAKPPPFDRADPPEESPWAMQLVVRAEKDARPSESAACAAAAVAVVTLLDDERALPGGPWADAIERWLEGRIRKVTRRARAHAWEVAQRVDGVTVEVDGAEARAYVPGPRDAVPAELARLQIRGLDLEDPDRIAIAPPRAASVGLVIALAPLDPFTSGKKAAAAGHAAQLAAAAMDDERRRRWRDAGYPVTIVHPSTVDWRQVVCAAPVAVADAGFTEVEPGTVTATASWS